MISISRTEQGFTLLEVLVAFVVLSLSLGVILQIFSLSTRITRAAEIQQQAVLLAESKMAELLAEPFIETGSDQGGFDGQIDEGLAERFRWQTEVSDYQFPDQSEVDNPSLVPFLIEVSVSWDDAAEQGITLTTIQLERQR
jgi:general secretion pathway protein I